MLSYIIDYSLRNKLIILLATLGLIGFGLYATMNIPIGAVPDITNNQVQVITTSRDLPTEEVERYLTYPVELEMSNLPGVTEIRSISKFGLSVVTIVFEDDMGTYLPRQLINERLKAVEESIPNGFGTPSMGPISTGLGEIYQYILDIKPGYEDKYSITDLRTIQDWIVKRQLAGIDGVVEVNTWGGFLKTYQVSVDPTQMQALGVSIHEVFTALEDNNSVAGGSYIEKSNEAFFIRAEGLVESVEDIKNVIVAHKDGLPILVKDIGKVEFGTATRFGAITGNGEGEKVLGQVMMLKGADSKKVIDAVIERVESIQPTLPEGIYINPFLERSELIGKTTFTIAENLILGFLIVLFVVVFLLGNIRSGLIVASVIPLTLLFALTLMYIFGVDANLMSLGAIDFGIIIDGAVIIVEYIAYTIHQKSASLRSLQGNEKQSAVDGLVKQGAAKMMHSAVFGQIIIIIVFIPILALTGVEGKMFKPMALTFCFAIIGAMILCFTYVPVMSSIFLKGSQKQMGFSVAFIDFIKRLYRPALHLALRLRWFVLGGTVIIFVLTAVLFSRMGGEFVPTLDEGDFVIQPVLKTGMSLSATVDMTTRIERILKRFPEVDQVVSRIGAAEVPTDPMSMEESDVIITLQPKSSWTSAASKDELADVFKAALIDEIPGVEIEFTQPIEMRFNELISGARADLAISLYGEDLDILYNKVEEIAGKIQKVDGAADISIEKIDGLKQMSVRYHRQMMAQYGVSVRELNDVISMGFAGKAAGTIFEGESQFDIVVKYDEAHRHDISHLQDALVTTPSGKQLPLSEFASIAYTTGPAKIGRDNTKRRAVVGVNVRGRDLQSVVEEVQSIVSQEVSLPVGYYIEYGGQFENLEQASRRLMIAVPVALLLILIMLHFAFQSIKEALLIFSAIPLATIGGVLALYLRDMPFSISAGVGFIALFGIAVLNGIVLIEHFKELKSSSMKDIDQLIVNGASDRIRPVLLTAIAAALGFLPMAISTSAGAEVQRPLATVVIGGLVTATLLTLFILPILYKLYRQGIKAPKAAMLLLPMIVVPFGLQAQRTLTLDELQALAKENNASVRVDQLSVDRETALIDAVREIEKTGFYYQNDHNNIAENGKALHVLGAEHSFKWLGVHQSKQDLQKAVVNRATARQDMTAYMLSYQVEALYDRLSYHKSVAKEYQAIADTYSTYLEKVERKAELGESTKLEQLTAQQQLDEAIRQQKAAAGNVSQAYYALKMVVQVPYEFGIEEQDYAKSNTGMEVAAEHPQRQIFESELSILEQEQKVIGKEAAPEIVLGVFNGFNSLDKWYPGVSAGLAIPLSQKQYKARQKATLMDKEIVTTKQALFDLQLSNQKASLENQLNNLSEQIDYQEQNIATLDELISAHEASFSSGGSDYFQYLLVLDKRSKAFLQKYALLHQYNQTYYQSIYLLNL